MADGGQIHNAENTSLQTIVEASGDMVPNAGISENILQRAFEQADDSANNSSMEYPSENVMTVADEGLTEITNSDGCNILTAVAADGTTYRIVTSGDQVTGGDGGSLDGQIILPDGTQAVPVMGDDPGTIQLAIGQGGNIDIVEEQQTEFFDVNSGENVISLEGEAGAQIVSIEDGNAQLIDASNIEGYIHQSQDSDVVSVQHQQTSDPQQQVVVAAEQGVQMEQPNSAPATITMIKDGGGGGAGNPPLGSSDNPIRIVQQGNQYTSLQQLTPEQLSQIMQVVQQQQVAASSAQGSTVLFNPQTQTKIVYKVLYPSQLHKADASGKAGGKGMTIQVRTDSVSIPSSRRPYRKRRLQEEEEERIEGPELSKEEKEMKKKFKPRTRSGRVSRPPKHMVKDYKHIHLVEWDEDYDDSDGGYSDYQVSDEEKAVAGNDDDDGGGGGEPVERVVKKRKMSEFVYLEDRRPFACAYDKCNKSYMGERGLNNHYRRCPNHQKGLPQDSTDTSTQLLSETDNSQDVPASLTTNIPPHDENSQPHKTSSPPPVISLSEPTSAELEKDPDFPGRPPPAPRGRPRGRPPVRARGRGRPPGSRNASYKPYYEQENNPSRRRARLCELVRQCSDEELMEHVLPRLTSVITPWEFLLMKVESESQPKQHFPQIYNLYTQIHAEVKKRCSENLLPATDNSDDFISQQDDHYFRVPDSDADIAASLGLSCGTYKITNILHARPQIHYARLGGATPTVLRERVSNLPSVRTVQVSSNPATNAAKKQTKAPVTLTAIQAAKGPVTLNSLQQANIPVTLGNLSGVKAPVTLGNLPTSKAPVTLSSLPVSQPVTVTRTDSGNIVFQTVVDGNEGIQDNSSKLELKQEEINVENEDNVAWVESVVGSHGDEKLEDGRVTIATANDGLDSTNAPAESEQITLHSTADSTAVLENTIVSDSEQVNIESTAASTEVVSERPESTGVLDNSVYRTSTVAEAQALLGDTAAVYGSTEVGDSTEAVGTEADTVGVESINQLPMVQSVVVKAEGSPKVQFSHGNTISAAEGELVMNDGQLMQVCGGELVPVTTLTSSGEPLADVITKEITKDMEPTTSGDLPPGVTIAITDDNQLIGQSQASLLTDINQAASIEHGLDGGTQILQTEDGTLLIQNANGTFQVTGAVGQGIDIDAIQRAVQDAT